MEDKLKIILENTLKMYQTVGIKSVTMDDVAKENSISKKTLYKFVKDKSELIEKCIFHEFENKNQDFQNIIANSENAIDEVIGMFKTFALILQSYYPAIDYDLTKYYPAIQKKIEITEMKRVFELLKQNFIKGQAQGLYKKEIDTELIAKMLVMFHFSRLHNEIVSYIDFTNPVAFRKMFAYHLNALCTAEGFKKLEEKICCK